MNHEKLTALAEKKAAAIYPGSPTDQEHFLDGVNWLDERKPLGPRSAYTTTFLIGYDWASMVIQIDTDCLRQSPPYIPLPNGALMTTSNIRHISPARYHPGSVGQWEGWGFTVLYNDGSRQLYGYDDEGQAWEYQQALVAALLPPVTPDPASRLTHVLSHYSV